ncbi:MAG: hypothetical protein HYW47_05180 [Deltaproteobacteria bacterium]|nr:hypothetical protein [Deltaproteobacteria bacterium]
MDIKFKSQFPFYEVWYGKLNIDTQRAFWFRYTLLHGQHQESALWALFFDQDKITYQKKSFILENIRLSSDEIHLPQGKLTHSLCKGELPHIKWTLSYKNRGGSFDPIPPLLKLLHLTQSHTHTPMIDLEFSGTIEVENNIHTFQKARGMIGHVWGKKQAHAWAWAHCNHFKESQDIIFEGLSGEIQIFKKTLKPLTSLYLKWNGKEYYFNTLMHLFKTSSSYGYGFWNFTATHPEIILEGKIKSLPQNIAQVQYTDTDGSTLYCYNSKKANLELTLCNRKNHQKMTLHAEHTAALEWVTRTPMMERSRL